MLLVPVWAVALVLLTWLTSNPGLARLLHSLAISLPLLVRNAVDPLALSCARRRRIIETSQLSNLGSSIKPRLGLVAVHGGSIHPLGRMYERLHPSIQNKRPGRPSFRRVFCLVSPSRILVPRLRLLARRFLFR
ncbi:hypothetical protein HDV64DRAFT_194612 [Trichoderma sp. TUCIM 5745]